MALGIQTFAKLFRPTWQDYEVGMILEHIDGRRAVIYTPNVEDPFCVVGTPDRYAHYVVDLDVQGGDYWYDDEIAQVYVSQAVLS